MVRKIAKKTPRKHSWRTLVESVGIVEAHYTYFEERGWINQAKMREIEHGDATALLIKCSEVTPPAHDLQVVVVEFLINMEFLVEDDYFNVLSTNINLLGDEARELALDALSQFSDLASLRVTIAIWPKDHPRYEEVLDKYLEEENEPKKLFNRWLRCPSDFREKILDQARNLTQRPMMDWFQAIQDIDNETIGCDHLDWSRVVYEKMKTAPATRDQLEVVLHYLYHVSKHELPHELHTCLDDRILAANGTWDLCMKLNNGRYSDKKDVILDILSTRFEANWVQFSSDAMEMIRDRLPRKSRPWRIANQHLIKLRKREQE